MGSGSEDFLEQLVIVLFFAGFYFYYGLCLLLIAQHTRTKNAWWAWVPILNGLLFFRIAERPLWWAALVIVPVVNVYVLIRVLVDVCRRCGESGWLTILLLIPGLNLFGFTALTGAHGSRMAKLFGLMLLLLVIIPGVPLVADMLLHRSTSIQLYALKHDDAQVRVLALQNLSMLLQADLDLAGPSLALAIMPALADRDAAVRRQAAWVFNRENMVMTEVLVALIDALDDPDPGVRSNAAHALTYAPDGANLALKGAIPQLLQEMVQGNDSAGYALGRIGPEANEAVDVLLQALLDRNVNMRRSAVYALGRIGTQPDRVVPALVTALEDNTIAVGAAFALGLYGPAARDAVPALRRALNSSDGIVRRNAEEALKKIQAH